MLDKKTVRYICLAAILFILAFTPLRLISLIGCIGLWAVYWPFSRSLNSLVLRLVLAFTFVMAFQQLTGIIFWLLHIAYTVPVVVGLELIVFLILAKLSKRESARPALGTKADLTAGLLSLFSVGLITFTTFSGGHLLQQLIRQSTAGYDGVQHISLTLTLYDNKGYMYGHFPKLEPKILFSNLPSYPQGWSLTSSLWWHGFSSSLNVKQNPATVLLLFFILSMLWFGVMIYLFARLILYLLELNKARPNSLLDHAAAIIFTGFAEIALLVGVPYNSFVSFYPAMVFPLAMAFSAGGLLSDKHAKRAPDHFLIEGLLLAGGIAFSWLLAAPAAYITVALVLVAHFNGLLKPTILWLCGSFRRLLGAAVLIALASGQGFVQLEYGLKGLVNYVGTAGVLHNLVLYTFLLVAVAGMMYSKVPVLKRLFTCILAGPLITAGAVYIYQIASAGNANYFSTKITFITFMLILVFAAVFVTSSLEQHVVPNVGPLSTALLLTCLIAFVPVASNMQLGVSDQFGVGSIGYLKGERFLSEDSAAQISTLLQQKKIFNGNLVVNKQEDYAEDIVTTHFIQMLARRTIPVCQDKILLLDLVQQWALNPERVIGCAGNEDFYVIASSKNYNLLKHEFRAHPNIKVILSN